MLRSFFDIKNMLMHLLLSLSVYQGTGQNKRCVGQGDLKEEPPDQRIKKKEAHLFFAASTSGKVHKLLRSDPNLSMASMIHLILSLSVEQGTGLIMWKKRQEDIKEKPPDREARRLELESFPREHKCESSNQCQNLKSDKDFFNQDEDSKGVFQLKEEPPDLPNSVSFRGKLLNPYTLQWTNLLYLCVGDQVLRSKLFEEGGYDEDMTSMDLGQLGPEEIPTVADRPIENTTDPTGDKRRDLTRGSNSRQDHSPTRLGNSRRTLAARCNFTSSLAHLANALFTHQEPYLDVEENVPFDPGILGEPPGDISATLGNFPLLMAAHGNLIRRLLMAFQGPTEADQDLLHSKGNLPYLPELKGNLTEVTSGITKEMTANFQDPDPTLNRPRPTFRSPTRSYYGFTLENSLFTAIPLLHFTKINTPTTFHVYLTSLLHAFIIPPTALSIFVTPSSLHLSNKAPQSRPTNQASLQRLHSPSSLHEILLPIKA